ncbi:unnamed protein product [Ceratitis capitata]|uniref:(Mediterranean fruit fly) hypothetical protein n=1 Tax=Ceratitis capitata TaxID=7213 RepID=A0A811UJH8_CERCA|nr:unnamed protein product [Ceratitis capitata]
MVAVTTSQAKSEQRRNVDGAVRKFGLDCPLAAINAKHYNSVLLHNYGLFVYICIEKNWSCDTVINTAHLKTECHGQKLATVIPRTMER